MNVSVEHRIKNLPQRREFYGYMGLPSMLYLLYTHKYTLLNNIVERFSDEWI